MSLDDDALTGFSPEAGFSLETAASAPTEAGVHVVLDENGEVLYVGRTGDLRRRLREHLQGDRQASVLHEQVGAMLDRDPLTASAADIRDWLGRGTVRWRLAEDPADLKAELVTAFMPRFDRASEAPRTGVWWVYQGSSYDAESALSIVFAGSDAPKVAHHLSVGRMQPGDVVIHYRRGNIVAIGEAAAEPVHTRRPYGPDPERDDGWMTRVEYFPLATAVPLTELPHRDGSEGPFRLDGQPKQGYLFPVESSYAEAIRTGLTDRWPAGSPWAGGTRRFWLSGPGEGFTTAGEAPATARIQLADAQPGDGVVRWVQSPKVGVTAVGRVASPHPESVSVTVLHAVMPALTSGDLPDGFPLPDSADTGSGLAPLSREQWRQVWSRMPVESAETQVQWVELVHWAGQFADAIDLDLEEREYKLVIRDKVVAARAAVRGDDADWPRTLRRAFGQPNNLTSWQMHANFLDWVEAHKDEARTALLALWDQSREVPDAVDAFVAALPRAVAGSGMRANLVSFLLAARGIEQLPVFRPTAFEAAYRLTGFPRESDASPTVRYADALRFLDGFADACRAAAVEPMRDRLDAQCLLWQVMSGNAPPGWSADEVAAYQRFLRGQTVDELGELVEQFRVEVGYPGDHQRIRVAEREELAPALSQDGLADPDVRILRRLAGPAYGSPGPQPGFNRLLQTDESVAQVTETLRFLLYGPGDLEERLDDCIRGEHKLPGVAEAMMVKALAVRDPERWIPSYVTAGKVGKQAILDLLGEQLPEGLSPGAAAAASNDRIRERLEPYLPDDPWGMQEFAWWLLHRERVPDEPLTALADELYFTEEFLERILRLLDDKGQVVFYGPPGTGKTYLARKLAGYIARGGGTVEKVQFHPSYAYEDFVEGYRPRLIDGQVTYEVVDGPLKRLAATAQERPDLTHVLLIDELNRGNVAKVLGELLFLLEYRDEEIRLQYSDTPFALPPNLRIIATMNTADRSIALVDTALRRRFHFVPFFPDIAPIDTLLRRWLVDHAPELAWVADVVDRANAELADRNVAIGPSHFLRKPLTEELVRLAWDSSVLPFLEEHYFSDPDQLKRFDLDRLRAGKTDSDDALPSTGDPTEPVGEP